jgi:light-regulated signal transduction histidine kinase (bacteriophytochrome)
MKLHECQRMLDDLNKEMDQMLYAISHDLRAPLRAIDGFSQAVVEDYGDTLDETARDYLDRVRKGGQKVNAYIDGLLHMSREVRGEMQPEVLDLSAMVEKINATLAANYDGHDPQRITAKGISVLMDRRLGRTLLTKLLDNAWKFTVGTQASRIEFGTMEHKGKPTCFIRDNGAGFDMNHAHDRLFGAFQRMHPDEEFEGLGMGLATARRIINLHSGEIWAESEPGYGTTIFFHTMEK